MNKIHLNPGILNFEIPRWASLLYIDSRIAISCSDKIFELKTSYISLRNLVALLQKFPCNLFPPPNIF